MKKTLFASLLIVASAASASPFGLKPGMSLSDIKKVVDGQVVALEQPNQYKLTKPPVPSPYFDEYRLLVTPPHGLCKLIAWSAPIETSVYGDAVQTQFDALFDALSSKYGKSEKHDFLRSGSIWNEPRDWTMALAKQERVLSAFWGEEHSSEMPSGITDIKLDAIGVDSDTALIGVVYEFSNFNDCAAWAKSKNAAGL